MTGPYVSFNLGKPSNSGRVYEIVCLDVIVAGFYQRRKQRAHAYTQSAGVERSSFMSSRAQIFG